MHRETRSRRLADCESGARVVDVVVGEDHPVDSTSGVLLDVAKHGPDAARVAGVDDRELFRAAVEVRLGAPDARDRRYHVPIIEWGPRFVRGVVTGGGFPAAGPRPALAVAPGSPAALAPAPAPGPADRAPAAGRGSESPGRSRLQRCEWFP